MFQDVHVGLKEHVVDNKSLLCSDLMDATYDFGLQILCASIESIKEKSDATVVPVLFLRNICRHIKATAILARNAFAEPCDLTLRAHFESCIGLSYMLKENTARRAAAYRIVDLLDQIRRAKEISPATNEGKRLRTQLQGDRLAKLDNPIYANLPQEIIKLDNLLAELTKEQNCRTAYDEYRKIEKETKNRQYPAWYWLWGGPRSLRRLANRTRMQYMYETVYHLASKRVHGLDVLRNIADPKEDGTVYIPIMSSSNIEMVAAVATNLAMISYEEMIRAYCPFLADLFTKWIGYANDMRKQFIGCDAQ